MELHELSKKIVGSIEEAKKTKQRGYVAFAIKTHAHEISELFSVTYYKIPDLFKEVSAVLGKEPCHHRNFRTLCDRYCDESIGSPSPAKPHSPIEKRSGKTQEGGEDEGRENTEGNLTNGELGPEWQDIIDSLGPAKKQQLPLAVSRGLTLEEATNARQVSTKELKNVLTTYSRRKH